MKYFDTHVHINIKPLSDKIDSLIEQYEQHGIMANIIGTCIEDSLIGVQQAKKSQNFYCSIGIHPTECYNLNLAQTILELKNIYKNNQEKIKAIGECGLDYHYENTKKDIQLKFFKAQIELAIELKLTLILHIRDAHQDAINILSEYNLANVIVHCYTDNLVFAQQYIKMGFYVSFAGMITFKKADELRSIVRQLNRNYVLSETDGPWLSPEPNRGKINDSINLVYINEYIAKEWNLSLEETNEILFRNAFNVLKL